MTIEEYYKELAPKLTSYLVADGVPYHVACEIVQESFLRLWKRWDEVEDVPKRVSGLLYTIVRNLRNDRYRHERFTVVMATAGLEEADPSIPSTHGDDLAYLRERLSDALGKLPPLLRKTYLLFHISEFSVRDIAILMNVTESLVKVRIFRAKEKLQALLDDLKTW